MYLALSDDQRQIIDAIDALAKPYLAVPLHDTGMVLVSAELDAELAANGFLDVGLMSELGPETPALVVERIARLPFAVEAAMTAMVRPLLDADLPRPLCLVEEGKLLQPLRFLKAGATVVVVGDTVRSFTAGAEHVAQFTDEALYAYPMARLTSLPDDMREYEVTPDALRSAWRVALAAEAAGLLAAALASVVTYVSERKQFGRPLATFQAMRHRLAEAQVLTNGVYWLAIRAAASGEAGDAALAALHAQEAAKRVCYDFHQFMGGMGMTLEHPLHLWTYRLKALSSELGGRGGQALTAADALWGAA
jgi:alkylation response protein AidB-like acyl-CoA dehydrogenase